MVTSIGIVWPVLVLLVSTTQGDHEYNDDDFQHHKDPTDESDEGLETGEILALIIGVFAGGVTFGLTIKCFCEDCCKNCCNYWFNQGKVNVQDAEYRTDGRRLAWTA
ncbi:uncharacterized protein LOC110233646 [Exaiptasia diaphana]|uniref:Transmembrane protein n=1 Tax=Exaiptasia diaphana TaxID=2652724 RepID=A0A913WV72_EXADI|nr:uncharacterized protein LOC110233646 [Exaiptasia diaphana]KXJ27809.1 hypothetical protein AC249_AIPGENE9060 [Exaiptasia diaphana]